MIFAGKQAFPAAALPVPFIPSTLAQQAVAGAPPSAGLSTDTPPEVLARGTTRTPIGA